MAYSSPGDSRGSGRLRSDRQGSRSSRSGSSQRSSSRGSKGYSSKNNLKGTRAHDTGYTLQRRSLRFNDRRSFFSNLNLRAILLGVLGIVIVILLVVGISSCVRGCSSKKDSKEDIAAETPAVASGISSELSNELTQMLEHNDQLTWIAAHANEYPDERLVWLALNEPSAIAFVRNYPEAERTSSLYDGSVTKGNVPQLYNWDTRWGYIDYGDSALAITGSGPTCLSMAYMGISGLSDQTPADLARTAIEGKFATGDEGTSPEFFSSAADGLNLTVTSLDATEDSIIYALGETSYVIVQLRANTLTDSAHYALVVLQNDDGSLTVHDPTSTSVSSHTWDAATIAGASSAAYMVSAGEDSGW